MHGFFINEFIHNIFKYILAGEFHAQVSTIIDASQLNCYVLYRNVNFPYKNYHDNLYMFVQP